MRLVRSPRIIVLFALSLVFSLVSLGCAEEECPGGDEMVTLSWPAIGMEFQIDKYEASRYDSSGSSEGAGSEIACSIRGVQPWRSVSYNRAKSACEAAGKHLCTREEWLAACKSLGAGYPHPYGPSYDASKCNGGEGVDGPVATGEYGACASLQEVLDLNGNVREWVRGDESGDAGLAGGSFADSEIGQLCENFIVPIGGASDFASGIGDGFRCCK